MKNIRRIDAIERLLFICFVWILFGSACSSSQELKEVFIRNKDLIIKYPAKENTCNQYLNYAPDSAHLNHTPMRWLRINIHFVNTLAGNVNFSEEEGRQFAKDIVEISNEKLLKNAKMNLPIDNNTPILSAQYQYVLSGMEGDETDDGIYFHQNDELFQSNKKGGKHSNYSQEQFNQFGVRKGEVLNVFFLEHHPDSIKSPTYKASGDGIGFPKWIKVIGAYMVHTDNPKMSIRAIADNFSGVFNHEIGHSLGLAHTWQTNDGCDDTPLNANCWNIDRNKSQCDDMNKVSNNMMDYNAWRSAITPCQIGKVHYKLSDENAIQRKMLVQTWCDYKSESTIHIAAKEHIVWNSAKDLEGDIVIEKGGSLTLQCVLSLPKNAKILVKIGGRLSLDGATITNRCGEKWEGIEVEKQGKTMGVVEVVAPSKVQRVVHKLKF